MDGGVGYWKPFDCRLGEVGLVALLQAGWGGLDGGKPRHPTVKASRGLRLQGHNHTHTRVHKCLMHKRICSRICTRTHTHTHTQACTRTRTHTNTPARTHLCSELVGSLMVAGMVMRVRSLPIMFFISDHRLKPLPSGLGMGSRVRTPLGCTRVGVGCVCICVFM